MMKYLKLYENFKTIEEDRVQIRLGRNKGAHFGKVQNIIIKFDGKDITSEDGVVGLGKMNIVIKNNEIMVGDIFIPEKYRNQGIATVVYQKISDHFGLPVVNSKTKGFEQTMEGGYIWKNREKFEPRNQIRLYRIENPNIPYDESREGRVSNKDLIGQFFTDNITDVSNYIRKNQKVDGIRLVYVDITQDDLETYHVSKNSKAPSDVESNNWLVPNMIKRNYVDLDILPKITGNINSLNLAVQELEKIINNLTQE